MLLAAKYAPRSNLEFLQAAKYAPRKNLEKTHIRQICPKIGLNFAQKWLNLANPGL